MTTDRSAASVAELLVPTTLPDPFPLYEELHRHGSVVWNTRLGYWMVTSHAAARRVLSEHSRFSSALRGSTETSLYGAPTMIFTDPPEQARLRRAVAKGFAASVSAVEPRLDAVARALVEPAIEQGVFEAVKDIASPLPVSVVGEILGVPAEDLASLKQASDEVVSISTTRRGRALSRRAAAAELRAYFRRHLERLPDGPDNSLVAVLRNLLADGAQDSELAATCMLLLVAGHETTTRLLSNCLLELASQPSRFTPLTDGRVSVAAAVEELIRYAGPIHVLRRITTHPVEVDGTELRPGEQVAVMVAAANRDPGVFADPAELQLDRSNARDHLGFGIGPHYCLGAQLGRLECRALLTAVLETLDGRALELASVEWEYAPSLFVRGPAALPLKVAPQPEPPGAAASAPREPRRSTSPRRRRR